MKTLYLDCGMGAAGDMLTAALMELLEDKASFLTKLNHAGIPGVQVSAEPSVKCGITGTHVSVKIHGAEEGEQVHQHEHEHAHAHDHDHTHDHEHTQEHTQEHSEHHEHVHTHSHSSMQEICEIVNHLKLSERVKKEIMAVYGRIAEAESVAHGTEVSQIHFHEVGTMDAIADVAAFCLLVEELAPQKIIASPVHVGSGQVHCAHGILPVPAPATAYLLKGVPIYGGRIRGELCTPTGAALLRHFVDEFGEMPVMKVDKIGYGMGKKDFEAANCVRAMLGECDEDAEVVYELSCNVDDITAEQLGFAMEQLYLAGAREVYTIPVGMKKNRPGVLLNVICMKDKKQALLQAMFKHTTTLGVRETRHPRYILSRKTECFETPYGTIHRKVSTGYGVTRVKTEYEDLAEVARKQGLSLNEAENLVQQYKVRSEEKH